MSLASEVNAELVQVSPRCRVWAYCHGIELDYSRPGKPTDNPFIESRSTKLRLECLDDDWFAAIEEAQEMLEAWRADDSATGRTALYCNPTQ